MDSPEVTEASLVLGDGAEIAGVQPAATFAAKLQAAEPGLGADAGTGNLRPADPASVIDDGQVAVGSSSVQPALDEPTDETGLVSELLTTGGEKTRSSASAFLPRDQGDDPTNSELSRAIFPLSDDPENPLSQRLSGSVAFGHPAGCPCCQARSDDNGSEVGELLIGGQSDPSLFTGAAESNQTLADYLSSGYFADNFSSARKFNLSNSGIYAKNGALTYNSTANSFDGDGLSSARQLLVDEAFKQYEEVLGIDFQSSADANADFRFGDANSGAYAAISRLGGTINYVNININSGWHGGKSGFGNYTFQTILHEIGHGLGLGHQGDYNGSGNYVNADFANDSWQATMMSYFDQNENTSITATKAYLSSPMSVDWISLDDMYSGYGYGIGNAFSGDTTYGFNTNIEDSTSEIFAAFEDYANTTAFTLVDGSGVETLDVSGYSDHQVIDLRATDKAATNLYASNIGGSVGNLTIAAGTVIENAVGGTGDDSIRGNAANNQLDGGAGDDTLLGGDGDDWYVVDSTSDVVTESQDEGIDLIQTSVSYTLPNHTENIQIIGGLARTATGNSLNNILTGNAASSTLAGAGGNDIYIISNANNVVTESSNEGTDLIQASVSYTLPNHTENIQIIGGLARTATGNSLNNILTGNAASSTLAGAGGNDTYIISNANNVVTESSNEGIDLVQASVSYALPSHTENITLTGSGNINATGNTLNNILAGNSGNNFIDGGAGNDTVLFTGAFADYRIRQVAGNLEFTDLRDGSPDGTDILSGIEFVSFNSDIRDLSTETVDITAPLITGPSGNSGDATSSISLNENTTSVANFTANEAVSWSFSGGADQALFTINTASGALNFVNAPDFETPQDADTNNDYQVQVRATDTSGNTADQTVSINVLDLAEVVAVGGGGGGGGGGGAPGLPDKKEPDKKDEKEQKDQQSEADSITRIQVPSEFAGGFDSITGLNANPEVAKRIGRLYTAAFGRFPDLSGLQFWFNLIENNSTDIVTTSSQFLQSGEFTQLYDENLSSVDYVEILYGNVLGRSSDQGGLQFWSSIIDSGLASRADVLLGFADSSENIALFDELLALS